MQRVVLKIRTSISIRRTSQFLICHCRSIDPDLIAPSRIDISDEFSFAHMLEFSKLAVAFAVELGGYDSSKL